MKKLVLLALLFLTACQGSNSAQELNASADQSGVVGGTVVPYTNALTNKALSLHVGYKNKTVENSYDIFQCTASALSKRVLLTAAHCVSGTADYTQVELRSTAGTIIPIRAITAYVHPGYETNKEYDLALIVLNNDLPDTVEILNMFWGNSVLNLSQVTAAGYGRKTGAMNQPGDINILRTTTLNVMKFDINQRIFSVDQTHGKGICQGDSGGPAMVDVNNKTYVVGVVSKTRFFVPDDDKTPLDQCNYKGEYVNLQYKPFKIWLLAMSTLIESKYPITAKVAKTYQLN